MNTRRRRSRAALLTFRKFSHALRFDLEGEELEKAMAGAAVQLRWATI